MKWKIIHIDETDSTNRWLKDELHNRDGSFCVITDYQTAGRGCGTNSWESERGANLLFSILIHPDWVTAAEQFLISMAISNAIRRALASYLFPPVEVKWPNDIYVGDGKICGILIENQLQGSHIKDSIIGIGLNVNQTKFQSDAPNPVSMLNIDGRCQFSLNHVLNSVLNEFSDTLDNWQPDDIRREYRAHLYRREGFHRFRDADGSFEARLLTVEDDGHLLLGDAEGRTRRYAFKEVQFVI